MGKILFFALLAMVLSSGSIYAAVCHEKRYEQILPINFTAIVLTLMVFGLFNMLELGFYAVLAAAAVLWLLAGKAFFAKLKRGRDEIYPVLSRIMSPGMWVFGFMALALIFVDYGRVPMAYDEFSHWADAAKVMVFYNDFVTNPAAATNFPSYPPGMTLIQYFVEKLYILSGNSYVDWLLYYSYQLFLISFILPFVADKENRKPLNTLLRAAVLLLVPCLMYDFDTFAYSTTLIDPFLSVVLGCALGLIFTREKKDGWCCAYLCCAAFMLVLSKAAGLLLGAFVLFAFVLVEFRSSENKKQAAGRSALLGFAVLLPFVLWLIERKTSAISQSFSSKSGEVSLSLIFRLITHTEDSYRQISHDVFYSDFFKLFVRSTVDFIPVWLLFVLCIVLLAAVCRDYARKHPGHPAAGWPLPVSAAIISVVYVVGLCYTFALTFEEFQAVTVMGQYRYLCIILLALLMMIAIILLDCISRGMHKKIYITVIVLSLVLMMPFDTLVNTVSRGRVRETVERRELYSQVIENVHEICPEGSRVFVVGQYCYDPAWMQVRYGLRPLSLQKMEEWHYLWKDRGEDDYTVYYKQSPEDWADVLVEGYDYVAILKCDDYFKETYGELFAEGSRIENDAVYIIDKETGKLVKQS